MEPTLATRDVSQDRPCADCGAPLWEIHPIAPFEFRWGHISREDARNCTRKDRKWPIPA